MRFGIAVPALIYYAWSVYGNIMNKGTPGQLGPAMSKPAASAPGPGQLVTSTRPAARVTYTGAELVAAMVPRLAHDPDSAPLYDGLRVVSQVPRIVGGFCRDGVCRCFTQQGTDPGVSGADCARWIAAPPFDPYRVEQRPAVATYAASAPSS